MATINDGGNKELGVVLGCENSKILLFTLKGKMVKKIEYHKGSITAVQLTSQDVLVTGMYLNDLTDDRGPMMFTLGGGIDIKQPN